MMYRWRILGRARVADDRMVESVNRLSQSTEEEFPSLLRETRRQWDEHLEQFEFLQTRGARLMKGGADVAISVHAEHEAVTQLFDNLSHPLDGRVHVAMRQQLQALTHDLVRHYRHEKRRLLRPVIRRMSLGERHDLARSL